MKRHDARDAKGLREPDGELDGWARQVVGAALEVHRTLGPGFLESIYEQALCIELLTRAVPFRRQVPIAVRYKGNVVGQGQLDLLVGDRLVVELKAVEALAPSMACSCVPTSRRPASFSAFSSISMSLSCSRDFVASF